MPSWWEASYGLDPAAAADADEDSDGDGKSNLLEFNYGFNPVFTDTFLSYGPQETDFVAVQAESSYNVTTSGRVSYAVLAYDQTLRYDREGHTVRLKAGTPAAFYYVISNTSSDYLAPGYVSSGTLAHNVPAQSLIYGHVQVSGYSQDQPQALLFQPGSAIDFEHNPQPNGAVVASGYVSSGTITGAQTVFCGNITSGDGTMMTLAAGSFCTFAHFSTGGSWMSGFLKAGKPAADTILPYSHIATGTNPIPQPFVKVKAGVPVLIRHYKLGGSNAAGYLETGTLAEDSFLYYGPNTLVKARTGTHARFGFHPSGYVAYGFVESCIPAENTQVRFGSQTSPDAVVTILAGETAIFTRKSAGPGVGTGYLSLATLVSPTALLLPYTFQAPVRYAYIAAGKPTAFIQTAGGTGCLSKGFLSDASGSQIIYTGSGASSATTTGANDVLLAVQITGGSATAPATSATVGTSSSGPNPAIPNNVQNDGNLAAEPAEVQKHTLVYSQTSNVG